MQERPRVFRRAGPLPIGGLLATILLFLPLVGGCGSQGLQAIDAPCTGRVVCFVPGVAGDNGAYGGLVSSLRATGVSDLRFFTWGAPGPLFFLNFQTTSIHDTAEKGLAERISAWRRDPACRRIDLIGHSAGCGVILGALGRLEPGILVDHVVLLSPSVSPGYDLVPVLGHVAHAVHVFHSVHDVVFLKWRTSTFGTYDNVKTPAAGHLGFTPVPPLPPNLAAKLVQHPFDEQWRSLGNEGDHAGSIAQDFIREVVAPLLNSGD